MTNPDITPRGPFEDQAQAFEAAAGLRAATAAVERGGVPTNAVIGALRRVEVEHVTRALAAAGVELGAFDRRIAEWLATWDSTTVVTVLDWILRVRAAGIAELPVYGSIEEMLGALDDDAPEPVHALPPIDYPARVGGVEPGPRCGATGRTALFAADVTCPDCLADMDEPENGTNR